MLTRMCNRFRQKKDFGLELNDRIVLCLLFKIFRTSLFLLCLILAVGCDRSSQPTAPEPPLDLAPPAIKIQFPNEYPDNLVGRNVVLSVEAGIIRANWVQAIIDDRVVAVGERVQFGYLIDVSDFGTQGQKALTIRAGNEVGTAEESLTIKNNDSILTSEAMQFIQDYWSKTYDGILIRFNKTTIFVKNKNFPEIQNDFNKALEYWEKWSGLQFIITEKDDVRPIIFIEKSPKGPAGGGGFETALILLNDFVLSLNETRRLRVICHEIGHAIGIMGHPIDGSIMDGTVPGNLEKVRFHPYQQKAVKIVYSKPPGSTL
ncbi:MAG: hypothetical protein A2Y62_07025 [Candidatus Fischerbacteria bacterium RBG_13_37_8]|uniref:Uncharacterized protein n=1 Tax=Candidatus Fischerbacteria bacterium RBG_13_37_8 TaxID=1817863 RepID=A0A1F5VXG4_9BACT|nr:MAG: hypothetical protein A2Y62_07025 [Candidatus Fischerbacteria bacterium RBG_13_37_8]